MEQDTLFQNVKQCTVCRKPMPLEYPDERCPVCQENELFSRVKEFIRNNDVTEYEVAAEFQLPLRKIKAWIREGRIEYKEAEESTITEIHCRSCGASIQYGMYCSKCMKHRGDEKRIFVEKREENKGKMHFLE